MCVAAALLQVDLRGIFLLIILSAFVMGGLLFVTVFSGREARNQELSGASRQRISLVSGRMLCVTGLGLALLGAFFVSVATDILGMILGMVGYALGARVLGIVVIVLSVITLFIGLLAGQGVIPGSYDQLADGFFRYLRGQ